MSWHGSRPAPGCGGSGRRGAMLLVIGLAAALAAGGCGGSPSSRASKTPATSIAIPTCIKPENGTGCLPLAPDGKRVDLARPSFSNPTSITNPLHPSARLAQVIYGGQVDGKPFRTEFSRLPDTRTIEWNGQQVDVVTLQYLAFSDGRIKEVALDWFAQADDGAVWYFGEDVFNYEHGVLADSKGTWMAGGDGPAAMIMPANPQVGTAYRSENIPGLVFEEVTVKAVGQTVPGPSGPVGGALVVTELHMDGQVEEKVFAPGYGEFSTGSPGGDLEAASLAVPTDARPGPLPAPLAAVSAAVREAFDTVAANDWTAASAANRKLARAWSAYRSGGLPDLLDKQMTRDLGALARAVDARTPAEAHQAVLRVAQDDTDLHSRHRPVAEVDLARLELWARQLGVDAADRDHGAVAGDVASLGWVRDRVHHLLDPATAARLDTRLGVVRGAAKAEDLGAVAKAAPALLAAVQAARPG
jgi:hypothetical protein